MKSVLFLGNSFTFYQDLPEVFRGLSQGMGKDVEVDSVTKGGASLREFLSPENQIGQKLDKALERTWDCVIFQEQSFRPVGNSESFFTAAEELSGRFPGSRKYFYQTWVYRDGSEKLRQKELSYAEMYEGLRNAYREAATRCGGTVVPVGDAFCLVRETYPQIDLYRSDDFHPSAAGTYLAACLFMARIWDISPLDLPDALDLDSEIASLLRKAASDCTAE